MKVSKIIQKLVITFLFYFTNLNIFLIYLSQTRQIQVSFNNKENIVQLDINLAKISYNKVPKSLSKSPI